ncbi:MAG: histone methyltransferase set2 [Phylliscum demangeonii]|nr:MAG: histone methyltransferase set2 [Phylliscum demangeonii]
MATLMSPSLHPLPSESLTPPTPPRPWVNGIGGKEAVKVEKVPPPFTPEVVTPDQYTFQVIDDCIYTPKALGSSDQEALGCECGEEWDGGRNVSCGEDSDCINRVTKVECVDDECQCGPGCQNQRFQLKQYANVAVIRTEKKGCGLQAVVALQAHDFIYEYIGEVINEPAFRRRMIQYDEDGIKHFYFMSLHKGVFVDATRKGNLGRFCNHSCNPNCYVDKWVVGDKLRMGIFAKRAIRAGEELVFNYNVDRYGADPQPCYCGEANCTGFIGGRTQTERATRLPAQALEALGIDDGGDDWDLAAPKKARRSKKAGEDEAEYVDRQEATPLDESGVTSIIRTLMQQKEQWLVVKVLERVQRCRNERVFSQLVQLHGYQTLKSILGVWKTDVNVLLQVLDILDRLPRITRNKIVDSKIEPIVQALLAHDDARVESRAATLLKDWSTLEVAYRIPRKKRDRHEPAVPDRPPRGGGRAGDRDDRPDPSRSRSRSRSPTRSRSPSPVLRGAKALGAPTGPRHHFPSRAGHHHHDHFRPPFPRRAPSQRDQLPPGWTQAHADGKTYYYSASGEVRWDRPTQPAAPPPPPPKAVTHEDKLQQIINNITQQKEKAKDIVVPATPAPVEPPAPITEAPKPKKRRDRELTQEERDEKRRKTYEKTLFPHVHHVVNKYKSKLPREDLKRFGKELALKLVNSDIKNGRVHDPTKISPQQEKQVKKHVRDFLDKAVLKKRLHDEKKAAHKARLGDRSGTQTGSRTNTNSPASAATPFKAELGTPVVEGEGEPGDEPMMDISDVEAEGEPGVEGEAAAAEDAKMVDPHAANETDKAEGVNEEAGSQEMAVSDDSDHDGPKPTNVVQAKTEPVEQAQVKEEKGDVDAQVKEEKEEGDVKGDLIEKAQVKEKEEVDRDVKHDPVEQAEAKKEDDEKGDINDDAIKLQSPSLGTAAT